MAKVTFKPSGYSSILYCVESQDKRFYRSGMAGDYWPDADYQELERIIQQLHLDIAKRDEEIEKLKDFRGGTIHNSWLTVSREKLIEALQFQGATTKEAFKLADERKTEIMALKAALGKVE